MRSSEVTCLGMPFLREGGSRVMSEVRTEVIEVVEGFSRPLEGSSLARPYKVFGDRV